MPRRAALLSLMLVACAAKSPRTASATAPAPAKGDTCLLYGTGYAFTTRAPPHWRAFCGDELPADRSELAIVLPERDADVDHVQAPFMYFVVETKPADQALDAFVTADNARIAAATSDVRISQRGELPLDDGAKAPVWRYEQAASGRFELTAYADHGTVVVLASVVGASPEALDQLEPDLEQLLAATHFVSQNVTVGSGR